MSEYGLLSKTPKNKNQKIKPYKLILVATACIAALGILFFLSFYISYNKITADRRLSKNENDKMKEQLVMIEDLKSQLKAKEQIIEDLKAQIEGYKSHIKDLKEQEKYAKMIAEEMNKLPKETRPPVQTQKPSDANQNSNNTKESSAGQKSDGSKQSDVQKDIYVKDE